MKHTRVKIGVIADDITGAGDIGSMFAKGGYSSGIVPLSSIESDTELSSDVSKLDVIIIDTDSRFDRPAEAAKKVKIAVQLLKGAGCGMFHKKTCSVFRGNIGAEFDAMQDALGASGSMVIAGFPDNGRTTIQGLHYVNTVPLQETQFRNDPIHPLKTASLSELIARQSDRPTTLVTVDMLDKGPEYVRSLLPGLKKQYAYIIFDVRDNADLAVIAEIIRDESQICGSSAIGESLPAALHHCSSLPRPAYGISIEQTAGLGFASDRNGTLVIAGSITEQSRGQVSFLKKAGFRCLELDTEKVFIDDDLEREIEWITEEAVRILSKGEHVLLYTSNTPEKVSNTKLIGQVYGYSGRMTGKKISGILSLIAKGIHETCLFRKLVIAGGDTSAAVTSALEIKQMIIDEEIAPGIPVMYGFSDIGSYLLVLKSGSFGSDSFLLDAVNKLCST